MTTVTKLAEKLECRSAWKGWNDRDITGVHCSDLLSDVMAKASEGYLLITIQAHKNTVAVATLKDLSALLICSDRPIPEDMEQAAKDEDVPIFITSLNQYEAAWRVHDILLED
jgi:hypothetical protein